ncbi:MAG: hypothetical protein V4544_05395 [Pseudomonadota bacterium]
MQETCKKVITPFNQVCKYAQEVLAHTPPEFIKIHIHPNHITLFHIKNRHILDRFEVETSQLKTGALAFFLAPRSALPLQILIDNEDVNYRLISLRQTKWWNRHGLFNQIKIAEFDKTDWVYHEHVPCSADSHRYVFIAFKPSTTLLETFMYLNNFKNPVAKIQLTSVQQTVAAIDRIKKYEPMRSFCPWSLFIRRISDTDWLLSAQQYGAIVLSRRGKFAANNSEESTIEAEIATTLRYLQRNGYEEGENLTLITAGFSDEFNGHSFDSVSITDVIPVPVRDIDTRIQLDSHFSDLSENGFWILNHVRTILRKPNSFYTKGFSPRLMLSQRLAYWIPYICKRVIIPLSIACFFTLITYASKTHTLKENIKATLFKKEAMFSTTGDEKRRQAAANFNVFKDLTGENPLIFLKTLSISLTKEAYITQFSWDAKKTNNHWLSSFEAIITLPDHSLLTKRKTKNNKNLATYQQKVQRKLQKSYPNAKIIWLPIHGKSAYTLGVSWD